MAGPAKPPVAIRITRPYATEDEFLAKELETVTRAGVLLVGAQQRPEGVILRFEIVLANGTPLMRGEGRVTGFKPNAFAGEPGLSLRFTRLDSKSAALIARVTALREQRRASVAPPAAAPTPPPEPLVSAPPEPLVSTPPEPPPSPSPPSPSPSPPSPPPPAPSSAPVIAVADSSARVVATAADDDEPPSLNVTAVEDAPPSLVALMEPPAPPPAPRPPPDPSASAAFARLRERAQAMSAERVSAVLEEGRARRGAAKRT